MLFLRKVTNEDIDLLFTWANEASTRLNSFCSAQIAYEEHKEWFKSIVNSAEQWQYILMCDSKAIGQVRLLIKDCEAEINYSISEPYRGCGHGNEIIRLIKQKVRDEFPYVSKLIAKVKPSNVASIYCFEKNQFEEKFRQYEYIMENYKQRSEERYNDETDIVAGGGVKILYLTNNKNTLPLFKWIAERCKAEIFSDRLTIDILSYLKPELVISYNYSYLISRQCIKYVNYNIINMHISYLPWNKGVSPNLWSFIDDTPKGVTIHMLTEGLDEGDIIYQEIIQFDPKLESFESTYKKLNDAIEKLFMLHWDEIKSGKYKVVARKQEGEGSYHTISDLNLLKRQIAFKWSDNISNFLQIYHQKQVRKAPEIE
jgi:folate-dependent phosphoribosylglycinamide formyltransferase PurN/RimJ/RimL family protein N-acetyltransferase